MSKITKYDSFRTSKRRILESHEIDPAEPMNIKWVADLTDDSTLSVVKYMWENMTPSQRKERLGGISAKLNENEKLVESKFEELTPEIQSKIVTGFHRVNIQNELF